MKIELLSEPRVDEADRIMRRAFGTFLGLPDPEQFGGDASYVRSRWRAGPRRVFAGELDGVLVGTNLATRWGSFGFFGPLSIRPDYWGRGLATPLMEPILGLFEDWGVTLAGLFTFPHSAKHIGLYQKFGFRPRALTLLMAKPVSPAHASSGLALDSELEGEQRAEALAACRDITEALYPGLDVRAEIEAIREHALGDTVLAWEEDRLVGFAACHVGPDTEAGSGSCYVKFAAARTAPDFSRLIDACEDFAGRCAVRLVAGVNAARQEAYEELLSRGFRPEITGISMHRPNQPGFSRSGVFVLDDWL
jgi:GNAT superfamily N-acetyltransferase